MEEVRDPRFRRLSTVGALVNFVIAVIALIAVVSYHWAELSGAGYVAGITAILCLVFLGIGALLGPLVVAMHHAQHHICLKFRHATFTRMIVSAGAAFSGLFSVVCALLEMKVFVPMQTENLRAEMSWSFYLEIVAFLGAILIGVIASYEWHLSRKLGGDPTIYTRDPEGTKADTIVNPNFREGPRKGSSSTPKGQRGASRGNTGVHRNSNGVAMTVTSGLPYMKTANGGTLPPKGLQNGHVPNGRPPLLVPYDPNRTPLRSSLRRPKPPTSEDATDTSSDLALQNPSFANTSPPLKKKVRIHTQSTAV